MENMGSKIQKVREIRNVSQKHLANHLGVSQPTISKIERGKTEVEEEKLKKIAAAMDVDPEVIKNFSEKMVFNSCTQAGYLNTQTINPIDQLKELYDSLIAEKDLRIKQYQEMLEMKDGQIKKMKEGQIKK